ncbi:mannose-1-phosphate guanylyltransferase [Gracilimonas sp.]|uniref:mannose-1-phosphate guanylyltransferase n=1 Tax=Gracilimonas sp. TaxID=1974203 RepID=UPI003BA8E59F
MVYAVIMAGGSGTRFWPKSTKELPKQFLSLFGEGTMIQNTAKRIESLIPQEQVMVVTNDSYVDIVKNQLPKVPDENIVGEPVAKNTAPCVAIAAEMLYKKDPEAVMVVLPADHHITDPDAFNQYLESAIAKAESGDHLVTIGIRPDRPETGFGYIHSDNASIEEVKENKVHPVIAFTEKPDLPTAEKFLDSGDYFWNSGMFVWKAEVVLKEIERHLPSMYEEVKAASPELYTDMHEAAVNDFYHACESISIDYGIMENSDSVFVVPGEFGWNDVGSWSAVYELADKDKLGNAVQTMFATFAGSENNLVFSNSEKMISLVGVESIAVVETDDAILVCDLNTAQGVKQIVEQLKAAEDLQKFL